MTRDDASAEHVPVLLDRTLDLLGPALERPGAVAVDATLGLGGHSGAMLGRHPGLTVIGLDRDPYALTLASAHLAEYGPRFSAIQCVFDRIGEVVPAAGHRRVDAILFDLGVSSMQLDRVERGFAYSRDAALDMRMDPSEGLTAADVLNTYPVGELIRILRVYGDERFAPAIARAVVRQREAQPFTTSERLVDLIRSAIPARARRTGGNPAKRTFQALRIEVNDELGAVRRAIPAALDMLAPAGRLVVMSYHSGEDRIVKAALAAATDPPLPPGLPIIPEEMAPTARVLTRGAAKASEDEVQHNPRAASVRLRAVEKVSKESTGSREVG